MTSLLFLLGPDPGRLPLGRAFNTNEPNFPVATWGIKEYSFFVSDASPPQPTTALESGAISPENMTLSMTGRNSPGKILAVDRETEIRRRIRSKDLLFAISYKSSYGLCFFLGLISLLGLILKSEVVEDEREECRLHIYIRSECVSRERSMGVGKLTRQVWDSF